MILPIRKEWYQILGNNMIRIAAQREHIFSSPTMGVLSKFARDMIFLEQVRLFSMLNVPRNGHANDPSKP